MASQSTSVKKDVFSFVADDFARRNWTETSLSSRLKSTKYNAITDQTLDHQAKYSRLGVFTSPDAAYAAAVGPNSWQLPLVRKGMVYGDRLLAYNPLMGIAKAPTLIRVLPPTEAINGFSQSRLGDEWWKTIYSIPLDRHFGVFEDKTDPRGRRGSTEKALEAQFDPSILFIGGAFGEITQRPGLIEVERTIALPNTGMSTIYFPLLNGNFDNLVENRGEGGQTIEQLRDFGRFVFDPTKRDGLVSDLFASVDGQDVKEPLRYRQASETPFSYKTPYPIEDSLISSYGVTKDWYLDNVDSSKQLSELAAQGSVTIGPEVSDGYWMAVDIKGGDHTLNFGGTLSDDQGPFFALDITYNILNQVAGTNKIDILTGTAGNDFVDGRNGADFMYGSSGNDLLIGGNGEDVIDGGYDDDELWGDAGKDTFIFRKGYGKDIIFDFSKGETVEIQGRFFPVAVTDIDTSSGRSAQFDFGGGNILTFAGVESTSLVFQPGLITFI